MSDRLSDFRVTGTMVNYYFVCQRKLWLFTHDVQMEHESDLVKQGRLIDETSYPEKRHNVQIQNTISLDFLDIKDGVIHEVKKSDAMEEAHFWQVRYYIYFLKQIGITGTRGEIDYPKLKQRKTVFLSEQDEKELEQIIANIRQVKCSEEMPGTIHKRFCRKCAYFEFCWT
ncbi:CRISPR-associated protein Cas4 [Chloroherpeton thalassium]|nr:CRISPR-associated protein Cas4 [Chloroherpeton thalassium]